jgi:Tol biopolymer transport system component
LQVGILALAAGALTLQPRAAGAAELISRVERFCSSASAESNSPSASADGRYVAFKSQSRNLVAGQSTGPYQNVFLRDRVTGSNVLVSHAAGSPLTGGDLSSYEPIVSADGSTLVFLSNSKNLVSGQVDPVESTDLFLYERATGNTVLVSHAASSPATAGNGSSWGGSVVSSDGRFVAFTSSATDLIAGQVDTNGEPEVYLYDRVAGSTVLVSHQPGSALTTGNAGATQRGISADGRYLLVSSNATDLVPGQSGLFLYDRTSGALTHAAPGTGSASISADGNFIALQSGVDLVPGQVDPGAQTDVYLYDRQAGSFALVTHTSSSALTSSNGFGFPPVISADGRYVAYMSDASDLVAGQTGSGHQLFLYDRTTGSNILVSHSSASPTTSSNEAHSGAPVLSADGRYIAFASYASDLVAGQVDTNVRQDVFLYDRTANSSVLLSHTPASSLAAGSDRSVSPLSMSSDGRWIAYVSDATDLVDDDCNGFRDVLLHDRDAGESQLVSAHDPAIPALAGVQESRQAAASDDGRYVVFQSLVPHMAAGIADGNNDYDVFLRDRTAGDTVLVSESASSPGAAANAGSGGPAISADGRWVTFGSSATDLVAGQTDLWATTDLFLYDRAGGTRVLVTHTASSLVTGANRSYYAAAISADGRWVAFVSDSTNLVPGQIDSPWDADVFVFDRTTGAITLVSHEAGSAVAAAGGCFNMVGISADGRWIAFTSSAPDLVPGVTPSTSYTNVYLHDRSTGATTLVSRAAGPGLQAGDNLSQGSSLSTDGRFFTFVSRATNLVPGQISSTLYGDIFLYDRVADTVSLVSHIPGSPAATGNGGSDLPALSPEGTFVVFQSGATDLVAGQAAGSGSTLNLFLYDRRTGRLTLVSHAVDLPVTAANGTSRINAVGADGTVVYLSRARNLVSGQVDDFDYDDVFLYDPHTGANRLLSGAFSSATQTTLGYPSMVSISRNGRLALFDSTASNLTTGDYNQSYDIYGVESPDVAADFYTLVPCRLLDTRTPADGPALASGTVELLAVHGACGIPATARALAVNVTVVGATARGNLKLYPSGLAAPESSTINFAAGETRANNAIAVLTPGVERGLAVTPLVVDGGTVHLLLDVTGWFE